MIEPIGDWKRTHDSKELNPKMDGKTVIVMGWVRALRGGGKLKFIQMSDRKGYIQVTAKAGEIDPELMKIIDELGREYVIAVKGTVKANEQAPNGIEIIPQDIRILNTSEAPLPLEVVTKKTPAELPTRLDARFLDLRKPEIAAIFHIKDLVSKASRKFLEDWGFKEIHTPKIVAQATESGANVFKISYFGKEAYLAQSPQFYKQAMMAAAFEKVYEIAPAFRAEKHHTIRHVTEYTSLDFEISFVDNLEDIMKVIENMIVFIYEYVKKHGEKDLKVLGKKIEVPKTPFPRITMREAYELLKETGVKTKYGEDLGTEAEKALGEIIQGKFKHDFVFLTEFPYAKRPFYHIKKDTDWTESFDLLCKGVEITTGSLREHNYQTLLKQVKEKKVDPNKIAFYLDMFKFGIPPHGGTGTGVDRVVMQMLDLKNIREAILFPREPDRLSP